MKGKVILEGLEFYAYHGLYPEERQKGNRFIVDLYIETDFDLSCLNDNPGNILDYEEVYRIIQDEIKKPRLLLEAVAFSILEQIRKTFSVAKKITIRLSKLNPPIQGNCQKAAIELIWPD